MTKNETRILSEEARNAITQYIKKEYRIDPDHPWPVKYPDNIAFRHPDTRKFFTLIMGAPKSKLGLPGSERIDVLTLKTGDEMFRGMLLSQDGFHYPYHMHNNTWVSIRLDRSVPMSSIYDFINASYELTLS